MHTPSIRAAWSLHVVIGLFSCSLSLCTYRYRPPLAYELIRACCKLHVIYRRTFYSNLNWLCYTTWIPTFVGYSNTDCNLNPDPTSVLTLILIVTTVCSWWVNAAATSGSLFYTVAFKLTACFSCGFVCVVKTLRQSTTLKLVESAWFHRRSLVSLLPRGSLLIRWRRAVRVEHRATSAVVQTTRLSGRTRQLRKVATTLSRSIFRRILPFTCTKNDCGVL